MKKISKVVATKKAVGKKLRTEAARETIGIDLGDKVSRCAILDAVGELVEEGSFRNTVSLIEKIFGGDTQPARIAMEVGTQSAWIERELKQLGHEVIVANARELAWITSSDTKNDHSDAEKLARLARADLRLLKPVDHRTAEQQAELNVIRACDALVRVRKLLVQCAHHILRRFGRDSALRQWGLKIAQHGGKNALKRAIVAVARKLAVLMHRLWRKAEFFQPFPLAA